MIWLICNNLHYYTFPNMPKNFKRSLPQPLHWRGDRKEIFPQIIKESNLSSFQAPALSNVQLFCERIAFRRFFHFEASSSDFWLRSSILFSGE
jgi:hypothetical protein